eukprot:TRINITY_DN32679_c0_g1_i1.p1 TRINITY_DN32679_c0_g1~~TRINITY_DN32679_c0_g1_i1.p1  ORF type:complete len:343 (+),score=66.77 TRINITY_DN32679_c0_g1_i1:63-1031(+)
MAAGRLLLVDVNGVLHRSFHAFNRIPLGIPNGGLRGVANVLVGLVQKLGATHLALCQDNAAGKSALWRRSLAPHYKEGRPPTNVNVAAQLGLVGPLCDVFGCKHVTAPPTDEADDLLASFAEAGVKEGLRVYALAFDKDLLQVVDDKRGISVVHTGSSGYTEMNEEDVLRKMGVPPSQVAALLALAGDSCDAFPGVPGVGPKRAKQLLARYGGVDGIIEAAQSGTLEVIKPEAVLSLDVPLRDTLRVAELNRSVPGLPSISELAYSGPPDPERAMQFLRHYKMPALAKRIQGPAEGEKKPAKTRAKRKKATVEEVSTTAVNA